MIYLKNIKNLFYYYYCNFLWLMYCLRLISLCGNEYSLIFCIAHFNVDVFLYIYFFNMKDSKFLNFIFFITLIVRCWQLESLLLFSYIIFFLYYYLLYYIYIIILRLYKLFK